MGDVLFTFLGDTNNYKLRKYRINNIKLNEKEDKLYIKYILNIKEITNIKRIYLLSTEEILGNRNNITELLRHFDIENGRKLIKPNLLATINNIKNIFKQKLNLELEILILDKDENLKDKLNFIKEILLKEKNNRIIFDITHAYRDLPLFYISLVNLIKFAEDININIDYLYVRDLGDNEYSKVEFLTELKELNEWSYAIFLVKKSFNFTELSKLTRNINRNLSDTLKKINIYLEINAISLLDEEIKKLRNFLKPKTEKKLSFTFELIREDLHNFVNRFVKDGNNSSDSFAKFQLELVKFFFENEMYSKAILILREFIITEVGKYFCDDKTEITKTKNREKITEFLYSEDVKNYKYGKDINEFLKYLGEYRNLVAHFKGHENIERDLYNKLPDLKNFVLSKNDNQRKIQNFENIDDLINKIKEFANAIKKDNKNLCADRS